MPLAANLLHKSGDEFEDLQLKFAIKNMLPIPSNSEQEFILDEYTLHLAQFSIAVHRIINEEISDESCVYLLKLLAGMYTLLKTTLLSPPNYNKLFLKVLEVEQDARKYFTGWALNNSVQRQVELFELGWWCEGALPRTYLVTLLFFSLPALHTDPKYILDSFSTCKSLQHPLKGSFLYSRFHNQLRRIYKESGIDSDLKILWLGYSVECFTALLRLFVRWNDSLPIKNTQTSYIQSLYNESFSSFFEEVAEMTSYEMFETILLPTFLVEAVNCSNALAQAQIFESIVKEFDSECLFAQMSPLIKSTSQFATGVDLKSLLDQLFTKIYKNQKSKLNRFEGRNTSLSFFKAIWIETSQLIKTRCEIDQSDTVSITALIITIISRCFNDENAEANNNSIKIEMIEEVLSFLIKTLKTIRPEGFTSETSVGKEILKLIEILLEEYDFKQIILKLTGISGILECLKASSARKCCLDQLSVCLTPEIIRDESCYEEILNLFSCFTKKDLVQLLDIDDNNFIDSHNYASKKDLNLDFKIITEDLQKFSGIISSIMSDFGSIEKFFKVINSSSSCLNLFFLPEILEKSTFQNDSLCKQIISSILSNTSTVLPQRIKIEEDALGWIEPEFTKLLGVKLNLMVVENVDNLGRDSYEYISEILGILSNNVSHDSLKIQIMENVLEQLKNLKNILEDDRKTLLENLSRQAGQLLRKSDRCLILLKICNQCSDSVLEFNNFSFTFKFFDQIISLLSQISLTDPKKIELSCETLELILDKRKLRDNEGELYEFLKETLQNDNDDINTNARIQKDLRLRFYSIKLKKERYEDNIKSDNDSNHQNDLDYKYKQEQQEQEQDTFIDNHNETLVYQRSQHSQSKTISTENENLTRIEDELRITHEDLQKLKIFETFQLQ